MSYAMKNNCPFCGNKHVSIPGSESATIELPKLRLSPLVEYAAVCDFCGTRGPIASTVPGALFMWDNGHPGYGRRPVVPERLTDISYDYVNNVLSMNKEYSVKLDRYKTLTIQKKHVCVNGIVDMPYVEILLVNKKGADNIYVFPMDKLHEALTNFVLRAEAPATYKLQGYTMADIAKAYREGIIE